MFRTAARNSLSLEDYAEAMKGIYTTCVGEETIDEAPMAYKSMDDIMNDVRASVNVIDILKPIYNFKASE